MMATKSASSTKLSDLSIQSLRTPQPAHPRLAERRRVQAQVIETAHRATEDVASRLHRINPDLRVDLKPLHDWRKRRRYCTPLVRSHAPPGPIDEFEIVVLAKRDA